MKTAIIICISILILFSPFDSNGKNEVEESAITINARLYPSGSFDGSWEVIIQEFPDLSGAEIKFTRAEGLTAVSFSGSAILYKEEFQPLKSGIIDQAFFELPENISPEFYAFHMPDYRLEICRGKKCYKVSLYDPENTINKQEHKRFKAIWDLVMKSLPKWPSDWPLVVENDSKKVIDRINKP